MISIWFSKLFQIDKNNKVCLFNDTAIKIYSKEMKRIPYLIISQK